MEDLVNQIAWGAAQAVAMCAARSGAVLDYSGSSLTALEEMIAEASGWFDEMTPDQRETLVQDFGCYILEVARREFGGKYNWFEKRDQPVLVVGEPKFRIAIITWDKVRGRLSGDPSDNILFFYTGFAERVRRAEPGTHALYV